MKFLKLFILCIISSATIYASECRTDQICSPTTCYAIIKQLGEGAFGEVFEVENAQGQKFALKSYKLREVDDFNISQLGDAHREFLRGQMLNHPHIIKAFDLFSFHSCSEELKNSLLLQLVEGKTLSKVDKGSLSKETAIEAAIEVCQALYYALSNDLVHIDLHQGNIMIDDAGHLMIIDLASFFTLDEIFKAASAHVNNEPTVTPTKLEQFINSASPALTEHITSWDWKDFFKKGYLDIISDICFQIIQKSALSRKEKLELRAEIKKIIWEFEEDLQEEIYLPVDKYFDDLVERLHTLKS